MYMYISCGREAMITISATKLRNSLFDCLDRVEAGETIVIQRNNREVARLVSASQADWRERMSIRPKIISSPEDIINPMDDIWEEYI